jgi:Protein of unknown function (DUF3352)
MRRLRMFLASVAVLFLAPTLANTPVPARAGGSSGAGLTTFAQVTPATAVYYTTLQSTTADQPVNLKAIGDDIGSQFNLQALLTRAMASSGGSNAAQIAIVRQVLGGLGKVFSTEFGVALLPPSLSHTASGKPFVQLHMLIDAGLQPGIDASQLLGPLALVAPGLASTSSTYRNLPVIRIDVRSLIKIAGGDSSVPANSPFSGVLYASIAGNDAVFASDLPTMMHAIDTWFGAAPSIASLYGYQHTVGALPAGRFLTTYLHVDTEQLRPLLKLARGVPSAVVFPKTAGTFSEAFSLSAETDGLLATASPAVRVGSLATGAGLPATSISEPSILPADTLLYAGLHDPGALIRRFLVTAYSLASRSCSSEAASLQKLGAGAAVCDVAQPGDVITKIDKAIGLNLDDDVFSWMHGDASIAVLPVGSRAYGADSPTTIVSLVATLQVPDQATVQAKLDKIQAALNAIPGIEKLRFTEVPSAAGNPLHMLAQTPTGEGYTYYRGYLIAATALPADMASMAQAAPGQNLASSPLLSAAQAHFGAHSYSTVFYANLTMLRQTIERIAKASGVNLTSYNREARPVLSTLKSLSTVTYAGPDGGGAVFIGIGR